MIPIVFSLLDVILSLVTVVLIIHVVLSWLIAFEIVSRRNGFVGGLFQFTTRLTDPMVRPLRRLIPPVGGVDLSILVLLLGLWLLRSEVLPWLEGMLLGTRGFLS